MYCPNTTSPLVNEINKALASKTACVTGIETESPIEKKISVFPNPSTGTLTIQGIDMEQNEILKLNVYNVLGQTIYEQQIKTATVQLDLSTHKKGIYFIQLSGQGEGFTQKVILE